MVKKKILLVIDKRNWAYDQIASYVIKELSVKYEIHKMVAYYHVHTARNTKLNKIKFMYNHIRQFFFESYRRDIVYDLVIYMWWNIPQIIKDGGIKARKELRGIFTESFPPGKTISFDGSIQDFLYKYIKPADGLIAGNKNILNFYENHGVQTYYATGAVDLSHFSYNRTFNGDSGLRVCWTGNPHRNFKGFFDFVIPAIKVAKEKYPDIELITRFEGPIATLPKFYEGVDIMVNASIGDAGPGFIIDAGACGVPTISTNVGFASEIIKDYFNGLIVERDINSIARKIIEVYENRNLLERMSMNIAKDIHENWGHQARAEHWDRIFQQVLS